MVGLGCGGGTETTPWWEVSTNVGDTGGGDFFEDDEDEDELEGPERFLWGELEREGDAWAGGGAMGAFVAEPGRVGCDLDFPITGVAEHSGCASCDFAVAVSVGEPEVYEDDGTCEALGLLALAGTTVGVGARGEQALREVDGAWEAGGFSELESDAWFFEFPL